MWDDEPSTVVKQIATSDHLSEINRRFAGALTWRSEPRADIPLQYPGNNRHHFDNSWSSQGTRILPVETRNIIRFFRTKFSSLTRAQMGGLKDSVCLINWSSCCFFLISNDSFCMLLSLALLLKETKCWACPPWTSTSAAESKFLVWYGLARRDGDVLFLADKFSKLPGFGWKRAAPISVSVSDLDSNLVLLVFRRSSVPLSPSWKLRS